MKPSLSSCEKSKMRSDRLQLTTVLWWILGIRLMMWTLHTFWWQRGFECMTIVTLCWGELRGWDRRVVLSFWVILMVKVIFGWRKWGGKSSGRGRAIVACPNHQLPLNIKISGGMESTWPSLANLGGYFLMINLKLLIRNHFLFCVIFLVKLVLFLRDKNKLTSITLITTIK